MSEELTFIEMTVHTAVALMGLVVAGLLFFALRKVGWGALYDFVHWTSIGLIVLSFFHLFEDSLLLFPASEEVEFFGEHAIVVAGFLVAGLGALELRKLTSPIKFN